jgi:TetR/AcrR family transcriptional regulator
MGEAARQPVQERAQITRDRLLAAAIELFAARGYDAIGTREIETAAGVKRGLISYHFGSKEALWKAAMETLFESHAEALSLAHAASSELDPAARLASVVRAFVRFSAELPEVNRIMVQEGKLDEWRLEWIVDRLIRPYYELTRSLHDEAVAAGLAPPMDHVHFHYILVGAAALIFSMAPECRRLSGRDPRDPATIEAHADALVRLLLPGANHEAGDVHASTQNPDRSGSRAIDRRSRRGRTGPADGHEGVSRSRRRGVGARAKR